MMVHICQNTQNPCFHLTKTGVKQTDAIPSWQCIYYIKKYSARVSSTLFLSSSQSPAIKRSRRITIKSPVSKFFGSKFWKKPDILSDFLGGLFEERFGDDICAGASTGGCCGALCAIGISCRYLPTTPESGIRFL